MNVRDLESAYVVARALGFFRGPAGGRFGQNGNQLGRIDHVRNQVRFILCAQFNSGKTEGEHKSSNERFHSGPATRLTLPRCFVKRRSMTQGVRLAILMSVLAVAVRLIGINQPSIDNWSWRQSDVAAIARNYFQGGFHFAHPQIDWAGDQPGYVGTEFPVLPFLAAICYKIVDVHEWVGRVQAVVLFAISLPFFFLLVRNVFGETAASWALFFYSFAPLGIMAGRCFMPDMPSLALSIIGLYFFQRWVRACKIDIINRERVLYLVVDFGQIAEHNNWRAAGLSRISAFQNTATPARSSISKYSSVDLRGDRTFTLRTLVRTRLPNRVAILSASLLRRRGSSNHVTGVVSENRKGNRDLDAHAFCFCFGLRRRGGHKNLP
ncbi:MAG: hypothetical protein DMF35_09285 [Verrucomicrobia bacterium]|nr:MAG: hypothetical protein DMF35_09285 [Verrucomicrobiota bacterium]